MDYLTGMKASNKIPEYMNISESGAFVVAEAEHTFTEMMKGIGIDTLVAFQEAGGDKSKASEKLKSAKDAVVQWLKDRWADIKNLVNRVIEKIQQKIDQAKNNLKVTSIDKIKKMASMIKDTDKDNKTKVYGKMYKYDFASFENTVNGIATATKNMSAEFGKVDALTNAKSKVSRAEETINKFCDNVGIEREIEADKVKENLKKKLRNGDEQVDITKDFIVKNIDNICSFAFDINAVKKKIKTIFNSAKGSMNVLVTNAKNSDKYDESITMEYLNGLKKAAVITTCTMSAVLECVSEIHSISSKIALKLVFAAKNKDSKEATPKNESGLYESSTFQSELATLFQF